MNDAGTPLNIYRCYWCNSLNNAMTVDWCLCANAQQTLVCTNCERCFCAAPDAFRKLFWTFASAELTSRRWQASKQVPSKSQDPSPIARPVLLVVDDSKVIHTVVDIVLAGFEGTIVHAYNGTDGLHMARAIRPEVLLTDALLPGLDGRDIVRLLKTDPDTAGIRAIVMTALYKGLRYRTEALREFLCDEYIEKPVSAARLRAVVAEMLNRSASGEHEALAS